MALLKKIKASTLMETLVATVLIVIVFMIASMILNNLFSNTIKNNTRAVDAHLNELEYRYLNEKLELPYFEEYKTWRISIESVEENNTSRIRFNTTHIITNKLVKSKIIEN